MSKKWKSLALSLTVVCATVSGCTPGNNVGGATASGAALGGILGAAAFGSNSWAGILGGALVGGIVGNQIGQSMDRNDAMRAHDIYISHSGRGHWTNPQTGYHYNIKPVKRYHHHGRYCREYLTTVNMAGKMRRVYGRACRMPDGSWRVMQ